MKPTIVNVYLVDGGSEWALIDTGMNTAESVKAFRAALDIAGCSTEKIRKIICTHHHPDHFGTSRPSQDLCHAEVFLHPLETERVTRFLPQPRSPDTVRFFERNGIPIESFAKVPSLGEFWKDMYAPARPDHPLADLDRRADARSGLDTGALSGSLRDVLSPREGHRGRRSPAAEDHTPCWDRL